MSNKRDYSNWSKDELVRELKKVEKRKKYGIVWEDKPEQVAELCKEKLPILEEERRKEIKTDKSSINVLVEGDNYHALSVLNYTHKGAIDIIYIDPPYNTGNGDSFKYNDKIVDKEDAYRHSKWLSFIEKRLWLAKSLLRNTGVFFVSIGDDEFAQLKLLCDEVFGENNFLANIVRKSKETSNKGRYFSPSTDYILCYVKNINVLPEFNDSEAQKGEKYLRLFRHEDKRGKYNLVSLYMPSLDPRPNQRYYIECPDGTKVITPSEDKMYRWIPATFKRNLEDDRVVFLKTKTSPLIDEHGNRANWNIYTKIYLHERQDTGMKPLTFIDVPNSLGSKELIKMGIDFPFSKPKELIKFLISITDKDTNITVLDFFAGSGTTGQAVLELNTVDDGNRKFILCTNNENNISTDICFPRIKKVIEGYKTAKGEGVAGLGGNLKYFKTDFVDAEPTDVNKKKMVNKSTEMLCLKEDCFDELKKGQDFKIFTNSQGKHLGIVYDDDGIDLFKKEIKKLNQKFIVYVFSLDESAREEEFEDVEKLVELKPIPAVILNVYKRIFK
jgi:adenine-specific DNA-methyltransferase